MFKRLFSERSVLISVCAALAAMSLWLQFVVLQDPDESGPTTANEEPDYYIENFTAVGMDETGARRYVLEAERLVHYPDDDTALLDHPHVIQYEPGMAPKHTYAKSGWVGPSGDEVLMTGDVRVIQGRGASSTGGVMKTQRLKIKLKKKLNSGALN